MPIPHKPGARPVSEILESPFNHRKVFPLVQLWELAESIRANGVKEDCLARPAPKKTKASAASSMLVELVYGHRRRRAAMIAVLIDEQALTFEQFVALEPAARDKLLAGAADRALLPLLVRDLSDEDVLAEQGRENFQRAQPSALEAADYLHTLMRPRPEGLGFTLDHVLAKTNKERPWVVKHLKLLGLSAEVRDVLYAQDLQNVDDYAFELARITDPRSRRKRWSTCSRPPTAAAGATTTTRPRSPSPTRDA